MKIQNERPHPIQALIDGMAGAWQSERQATGMTLGALIAELEMLPPERTVRGLGELASYRGYYDDLAFAPRVDRWSDNPTPAECSVADLLARCRAAMVACFVKQIANAADRNGGDPAHWPPGDWPREFPEARP